MQGCETGVGWFMNALNSELIAIALAIGGFFVFGYIYLMWNELSLEF